MYETNKLLRTKLNKTSAKGPFLGYLYQAYCALWLILDKQEIQEMSIESFDDISIGKEGKPIELIQVKHHVDSKSLISDTSIDFWKTLGNWAELFDNKQLRVTSLTLTILTTSKCMPNSALSKLKFGEERDYRTAYKILYEIAEDNEIKTNREHYAKFKKLDKHFQEMLVKNIVIIDSSPQIDDIEDVIRSKLELTVSPNMLPRLYDSLRGWWIKKVVEHIRGDSLMPIPRSEVHAQILDLQNQMRNDNLQIYFDESDVKEEDLPDDTMIFVKQLELISAGEKTKRHAKSDFYLASKNRSQWGRDDPLFLSELKKYDNNLKTEWSTYFEMKLDTIGNRAIENTKKAMGKEVLNWATFQTEYLCIRPLCKAPFVRRGSFHMLADLREIGWHPDYKKLLNN